MYCNKNIADTLKYVYESTERNDVFWFYNLFKPLFSNVYLIRAIFVFFANYRSSKIEINLPI